MPDTTRSCVYFEEAGKRNTDKVAETVVRRLAEGDIKTVVVSSTTGYTAHTFSEALQGHDDVTLISVAEAALIREWGTEYPTLTPETKEELERRGVIVADKVSYVFHHSPFDGSKWQLAGMMVTSTQSEALLPKSSSTVRVTL